MKLAPLAQTMPVGLRKATSADVPERLLRHGKDQRVIDGPERRLGDKSVRAVATSGEEQAGKMDPLFRRAHECEKSCPLL